MKYTLLASNYKEPPTFVLNSSITADSPYHAGLLFGKELHSAKTRAEFSIVISDTKKDQYEVHLKKRKSKGGWIFFGQVHRRKVKGTFATPNPVPETEPVNNGPRNNQERANTPVNNGQRNNQEPANTQVNNGPTKNQKPANTPVNNGPRNNQGNNEPRNNQKPANTQMNNGPRNNQAKQNGLGDKA